MKFDKESLKEVGASDLTRKGREETVGREKREQGKVRKRTRTRTRTRTGKRTRTRTRTGGRVL